MTSKVKCYPFLVFNSFFLCSCNKLEGHLPIHLPSQNELTKHRWKQLACSFLKLRYIHQLLPPSVSRQPALRIGFHLTPITPSSFDGLVHLVTLPPELRRLSQLDTLIICCRENLRWLANMGLPPKFTSLCIAMCELLWISSWGNGLSYSSSMYFN